MARNVPGKIKLQLTDGYNQSFNEYPCYTNRNFLDDTQTTAQDAQDFSQAWATVISSLTSNTLNDVEIEYTVNLISVT